MTESKEGSSAVRTRRGCGVMFCFQENFIGCWSLIDAGRLEGRGVKEAKGGKDGSLWANIIICSWRSKRGGFRCGV